MESLWETQEGRSFFLIHRCGLRVLSCRAPPLWSCGQQASREGPGIRKLVLVLVGLPVLPWMIHLIPLGLFLLLSVKWDEVGDKIISKFSSSSTFLCLYHHIWLFGSFLWAAGGLRKKGWADGQVPGGQGWLLSLICLIVLFSFLLGQRQWFVRFVIGDSCRSGPTSSKTSTEGCLLSEDAWMHQ